MTKVFSGLLSNQHTKEEEKERFTNLDVDVYLEVTSKCHPSKPQLSKKKNCLREWAEHIHFLIYLILCINYLIMDSAEEFLVGDRIHEIWSKKIKAKPLWWFVCHLDSVLKYCNGKSIRRITGQPHTKIWMHLFRDQFLQKNTHTFMKHLCTRNAK